MARHPLLRRLLPVALSAAIVALAARALYTTLRHVKFADVVGALHAIPAVNIAVAGLLVATLYTALALYEAIVVRFVEGGASPRRAVLAALLAAPIGHAIGWGAVSGGAIRYRIYSAVHLPPLDIGKIALLAAIPYPVGLGLLLGLSLVVQSGPAGAILHVSAALARGTGLALLALHGAYLLLIANRRAPLAFGRFRVTLPPPALTAVQYCVGIIEVCCGAGVLYLMLPAIPGLPFVVFLGVYVLSILAALASSVPAGFFVLEAMLVGLLPHVPQPALLAAVVVYRFVLEAVPFLVAIGLFLAYELWWKLPRQRRRAAALKAARISRGP
ncbi:MAG TPA: YbhN family protein [Steroidobacteraceae bacterium]|nr:YbhN family protein [Steroidobacteraceae bacterium]